MSIEYLTSQLGEHEKILYSSRQHWFFLVKRVIWAAVAFVALAAFLSLLRDWSPDQAVFDWAYVLLVIPAVVLFWRTLQWWVKVYVVTNRRVARVAGVLAKNVKDSSLEKVNDVMLTQSLLGRLLNYGNIEILTASELGLNKLSTMRDPIRFKTSMVNAKEQFETEFGHSS